MKAVCDEFVYDMFDVFKSCLFNGYDMRAYSKNDVIKK